MDKFDHDGSLIDDYIDDEFDETRPVYDEDFLDEDLLEDEFDESISDEYDEEHLNEEGFHLEENDQDIDYYTSRNSYDYDDDDYDD